MVTGDHPITAKAIAQSVGIISEGKRLQILLNIYSFTNLEISTTSFESQALKQQKTLQSVLELT